MNVGPRIWKTGLAVILSIWASELLGIPAMLGVIAAIIGIQPSLAQSFTEGWNRVVATIIGGLVGFVMAYFLDTDPVLVGLAVIISIIITLNLKLQNAVVLTAITAAAVMTNVTGPAYLYAGERLFSTIIGIIIGVLVNFLFAPPNFEQDLFVNIETLNYKLKAFYVKVLTGFIAGRGYHEEAINNVVGEIREALDETRKSLFQFKNEIGFRRGNNNNERVIMYESMLSSFNLIFERILGIYNTEYNRAMRDINLSEATPEYEEIIKVIKQLLAATVSVQDNLIAFLTTRDEDIHDYILSRSGETKELAAQLKEKIGQWHLVAENRGNVTSLMELANIGYEIEQIINFLERIVRIYRENKSQLRGIKQGSL
ncbi:aromatic acid exporter family protein [Metallumcola ferriviriculae]|uniref:Aromatic acid exporter family protein n=1 Tax=Metallumcola ferriviriculae TaxID=3039180 RepID=A0AAU0UIE7_9FIRM|nr:aromatic acid exporter family protein [Desulfitibacteraceae bacterium MK1]